MGYTSAPNVIFVDLDSLFILKVMTNVNNIFEKATGISIACGIPTWKIHKFLDTDVQFDQVKLNYASVIYLKEKIRLEGFVLSSVLPVVLRKLNSQVVLPCKITDLTHKIEKKIEKSSLKDLNCILHEKLKLKTEEDKDFIGKYCQSLNINKETLRSNTSCINLSQLSNNVVYELEQYRCREGKTYKDFTGWLTSLCNIQASVCEKVVRKRARNFLKKRLKLSRNKNSDLKSFMQEKFQLISQKTNVKTSNVIQQLIKCKQLHSNENQKLKEKSSFLQNKLDEALKECSALSDKLNKCMIEKNRTESELENLKVKLDIALRKISRLNTRNINKRIKRMESRISMDKKKSDTLKSENFKLESKFKKVNVEFQCLSDEIKSLTEDRRKLQKRLSALKCKKSDKSVDEEMVKSLRKKDDEIKELQEINSNLNDLLNQCEELECFKTREEGSRKFKREIQQTYMELLSLGVSCNNCSNVISSVLKNMLNIKVVDLPEVTFAKRMALQANLIAKYQVATQIVSSSGDFNTLQFDGTSKWGEHYFTFDVNTESGLLTSSVQGMVSECSTTQLEAAEIMFNELSDIYSAIQGSTDKSVISLNLATMIRTIKNTMSDRGPTNKPFIKLFQLWREKILPMAIEEWEFLNSEVKEDTVELHDFYCGLHLITNFAEYANKGLKNFEEICSNCDIGMESLSKFKHWKHGSESASQRLIRTSCELFQIQGNASAGRPQQFNSYLQTLGLKNNLVPFRGNRFNILFQNARAVFGHHKEIKTFIELCGQENDLIKAVYADVKSPVALAGTRALGLIDIHITRPIWHLLQSRNVNITDMSSYYQVLHKSVSDLCEDASPLLDQNFKLFDCLEPELDLFGFSELHLMSEDNTDFDVLTIQALELILASILVVIKRQLVDHLTGGKYENPSQNLIHQTKSVPKTNQSNESNFGQLERIKRSKPNASTGHVEGVIMYVNNKTSNWLSSQYDPTLLQKANRLLPKYIKKWRDRSKEIKQKRIQQLKDRISQREEKEKRQRKEKQQIIDFIVKYGLCKSKIDIQQSLNKFNTKSDKIKFMKFQIKYFHIILNLPVQDKELYQFSKAGHVFNLEKLQNNLCQILKHLDSACSDDDEGGEIEFSYCDLVVPSCSRTQNVQLEKRKIINSKRKNVCDSETHACKKFKKSK